MYYQGSSEIQGDGLHKLYLMNPNYIGYSDTQHQHQYFHEGIPLSHNPNRPSSVLGHQQEIQATHNMVPIPGFNHNLWESIDRPNILQQRPKNLSLSLSAHQTGLSKPIYSGQDLPGQSNRVNSEQSVILGSKYLKAAQQLLDEVANVGKGVLQGDRPESSKGKSKVDKDSIAVNLEASTGAELTTAQRQEILMKKAKLVNMLDEVEQRYRQYHQQMQIIVASFEQAAGIGSAKSYTHLALKTISKQFRCLKDALSEQIKALNKNLGEEEKLESSKLKFIDHQFGRHRPLHQLGMLQNSAWRPQRGLPESAVSVLRAWLFENFLHPYPKDSDKQMLAKQTGLTRSQVSNWFINARVRLWKPMVEEMYSEEMKNQQPQTNTEENTNKTRPKIIGTTSSRISTQQANNSKTSEFDQLKALQFKQDSPSEKNPKKPRNDAQDNSLSSILSVETEINKAGDTRKAFTTAAPNTNTRFGSYGIGELSRFGSEQFARGFHGNNVNNYNSNVSLTLALPPSAASSQITHQQTNFFTSFGGTSTGARIINETGTVENSAVNGIIDPDGASHPNIGYQMLDFQNRKPFPAQFFPDFVA